MVQESLSYLSSLNLYACSSIIACLIAFFIIAHKASWKASVTWPPSSSSYQPLRSTSIDCNCKVPSFNLFQKDLCTHKVSNRLLFSSRYSIASSSICRPCCSEFKIRNHLTVLRVLVELHRGILLPIAFRILQQRRGKNISAGRHGQKIVSAILENLSEGG